MGNEIQIFNPVNLMPATYEEKLHFAQILCKSGLIPQSLNTPEKVCVALQWGHELQLSPMVAVNNITVVNGKPTLSADVMSAVVKRSPEYGGIEWLQMTDEVAECVVIRRGNGYEEKVHSKYTIQDAAKAGLTGKDVWKKYPRRMLKHRCLSYALRDAFPDILAGLYNPEEMESVTDTTPIVRNITAETKIEPVVNMEAVTVPPMENDIERLQNLEQKYANELKNTSQSPTPYDMAESAIASGNEAQCAEIYLRCVAWLGKKGVQVA